MAQILVRDVERGTLGRLKERAKQHGRSLQGEVKFILIEATDFSVKEARTASERWHRRLSGQRLSDSAVLIREDRKR